MQTFSDLDLAAPIHQALAEAGYDAPTPIQAQAIPPALSGRDILGVAQTGTGKTAAFALPLLDRLARERGPVPRHSARVLVLAPTRELAGQIAESFKTYGRHMRLTVQTVFGGVPINRQVRAMAKGADVLVATPGRLEDLLDRKAMTLSKVEALVLDEADQMLDLGFIHALRRIAAQLPAERRTLFFSATMPKAIAELAGAFLTDPVKVSVAPQATPAERVEQRGHLVRAADKQALLERTLRDPALERALVFTRTKHGADRVVKNLDRAGIEARAIHGNKRQNERERTLAAFRSGACQVLVATDIAARGVDVPGVSHVVNFEIPNVAEQYVHRIGRTARAGAEGVAVSLVAPDERAYIRDIERIMRLTIAMEPLPEGFEAPAVSETPSAPPRRRGGKPRRQGGGGGAPAPRAEGAGERKPRKPNPSKPRKAPAAKDGGGEARPRRSGPPRRRGTA